MKGHNITLEQLDRELEEWQTKRSLATTNLLELDDLFAFKRLRGGDGISPAKLTGISAEKVIPALEVITQLWQYHQLLSDSLNRADELRKSMSKLWTSEMQLITLAQLLHGPSIKLPSLETPLAKRSLISAPETVQSINLNQLLSAMTRSFELAKDVILSVDAAWKRLDTALLDSENDANTLQQVSNSLGMSTMGELDVIREQIRRIRSRVESDPLGVDADLQRDITPLLKRVREQLGLLSRQRDQSELDRNRAHSTLEHLAEQNRQCEEAYNECRQKIEMSPPAPKDGGEVNFHTGRRVTTAHPALDPTIIADLSDWLKTLDSTLLNGDWKPASIGLKKWLHTADEYLSVVRAARDANKNLLEILAELRGRLSGLRAKSRSYESRGVAGMVALEHLAIEAESLLSSPDLVPLGRAEILVSQYEQSLNALLKGRN